MGVFFLFSSILILSVDFEVEIFIIISNDIVVYFVSE